MTLPRLLAAAAAATALAALGGCSSQAKSDGDFLLSARMIMAGTSMHDESDETLVGYAQALCRDLGSADSPEDVAEHDLLSLLDGTRGIFVDQELRGPLGWFAYRAVEAYCPEFTTLNTITSWKNRTGSSTPEASDPVAAPAPEPTAAAPEPVLTSSSAPAPEPSPTSEPATVTPRATPTAPTSPPRGALKAGIWRDLNVKVAVDGLEDLDASGLPATARVVKARITKARDESLGVMVPSLQLRVRNDTDAPLTLSLEAGFSGDVEAWFGGAAGASVTVAAGATRTVALPYNNVSGYAVPQFPSSYRVENLTVTASLDG